MPPVWNQRVPCFLKTLSQSTSSTVMWLAAEWPRSYIVTLPRTPIFGQLFRFYFFKVVPVVGGLISGRREAYTYLPYSALAFPRPPELARIMESVGLRDVRYRLAMFGTVAVHWGMK